MVILEKFSMPFEFERKKTQGIIYGASFHTLPSKQMNNPPELQSGVYDFWVSRNYLLFFASLAILFWTFMGS